MCLRNEYSIGKYARKLNINCNIKIKTKKKKECSKNPHIIKEG